jgi:hypothetical protein
MFESTSIRSANLSSLNRKASGPLYVPFWLLLIPGLDCRDPYEAFSFFLIKHTLASLAANLSRTLAEYSFKSSNYP